MFTLFLLLLHQLHLRSSGIRPGRLGTPVLEGVALFYVCTGFFFFSSLFKQKTTCQQKLRLSFIHVLSRYLLGKCAAAAAAAKLLQLCPTLCDPIDGSLPGSSVHRIFQARVLEWGAIAFSGVNVLGGGKYNS